MGIEVVVEGEDGERIASAEDPTNILHRVLPAHDDTSYQCLNRIDWYGDTTFNCIQIPVLLDEVKRLRLSLSRVMDLALLDEIETLARRSTTEPHLYLKFYGD